MICKFCRNTTMNLIIADDDLFLSILPQPKGTTFYQYPTCKAERHTIWTPGNILEPKPEKEKTKK